MFPDSIFGIITLYDILISVGIIVALFLFGYIADKRKIKASLQRFTILCACAAIGGGLGSAVLFQAVYNIEREGGFVINKQTGATFYGGLLGGVALFLAVYFIAGHFIYKKKGDPGYHRRNFFSTASAAIAAVAIGHSFGRVGCLMAGCCHGAQTEEWYGIVMKIGGESAKYVPTQLFEAIFLLLLFGFLFINSKSGGRYNLPIYMASYGAWRFFLEFIRDDYRGSIGTLTLTPSQLISILMVVGAIGVFVLEKLYTDKLEKAEKAELSELNKE